MSKSVRRAGRVSVLHQPVNRHQTGKRHRAVDAYLEDTAAKAFKTQPKALKEVLNHRHGIYALYHREHLYYVGLATNLFSRVRQHTKDKHKNHWDRFSAYVTRREEQVKELESLALRILAPDGNRVRGRLRGAEDLKRTLGIVIADQALRNAAELLGGQWVKRAKRRAVRGARGAELLAALSGRHRTLYGWVKGERLRAVLRKSGMIRFRKKLYDNPHDAAEAALGRKKNGWAFWHFDAGGGDWSPLRLLKKT